MSFNADTLIIDKGELLKVDEQAITDETISEYVFFYYDASRQSSQKVVTTQLVFIDAEEIMALAESIKENDLATDSESIAEIAYGLYGRFQPDNLNNALKALAR